MSKALEKLKGLSGSVLILGSSLADNDQHIFKALNGSKIEKIYASCKETNKKETYGKAKKAFPDKTVVLLDWETISFSSSS